MEHDNEFARETVSNLLSQSANANLRAVGCIDSVESCKFYLQSISVSLQAIAIMLTNIVNCNENSKCTYNNSGKNESLERSEQVNDC